jgi:gamma-D-glutamyl-L-lysine dipeptidyl-peptidase
MRSEAREGSEMVSQMLLGETAEVLERIDRWIRIRTRFDKYEGWVNPGQCGFISDDAEQEWITNIRLNRSYQKSYTIHHVDSGEALTVPLGAQIIPSPNGIYLPDGEYYKPDMVSPFVLGQDLISTAERFAGIPYLWGGRSDLGIDCSGFIQTLFAIFGYAMPRDSRQQYELANPFITDLKEIDHAQRGDLVFFKNPEGRIVHVGLYITDGCMIHAGPNVRINCFSTKWADRVLFPYDERLAERFCGVVRITDLVLRKALPRSPLNLNLDDRSPQIFNPDA